MTNIFLRISEIIGDGNIYENCIFINRRISFVFELLDHRYISFIKTFLFTCRFLGGITNFEDKLLLPVGSSRLTLLKFAI